MKDSIIFKLVVGTLVPVLPLAIGCALFTPSNVRGALDVAHAACVLFHDDVDDVAVIGKLCEIHEEEWPEVRKLVSARKQAAARKAAMAAPSSSTPSPSASQKGQ